MNPFFPRPSFVLFAAALALFALTPPLAGALRDSLETRKGELTRQQETLARQLQQWEEDAATARELAASMNGEDLAVYLAAPDRAEIAAKLEPLATENRVEEIVYTLGGEEPWLGDPAFPGLKDIAQSRLTLEGRAALDTDIFRYLESLGTLPGRMDLVSLTIKRGASAPPALTFQAELLWLHAKGENP